MDRENDAISRYYDKKKKRKKRRKYVFYTLIFVFFVAVITVLSLTVFFNISNITVTGNSYYSSEQVKEASGLKKGQNLFRLNKFKVIDKMEKKLPYASEVKIDRHLPVGIEIIITETKPYMYVETTDGYLLIDENLKILDRAGEQPIGIPSVTGITVVNDDIGTYLTAENSMETYLKTLAVGLKTYVGDTDVTSITVSELHNISFVYKEKVTVKLGTLEKLDVKLRLAMHVAQENVSNENAVLDVSDGEMAFFRVVDDRNETIEIDLETEENEEKAEDGEEE